MLLRRPLSFAAKAQACLKAGAEQKKLLQAGRAGFFDLFFSPQWINEVNSVTPTN